MNANANTLRRSIQNTPTKDKKLLSYKQRSLDHMLNDNDRRELDQFQQEYKNYFRVSTTPLVVETPPNAKRQYFVTFSPKPEYTLPQIIKVTKTFIKRTTILSGYYTYEQRSTDINNIHGIHVHFLIETSSRDFPRNTKRSILNKYVGHPKHIDIRYLGRPEFWDQKLKYIKGDKKDTDKLLKVKVDIKWRINQKLKSLYII